jgi:hypothetical protein
LGASSPLQHLLVSRRVVTLCISGVLYGPKSCVSRRFWTPAGVWAHFFKCSCFVFFVAGFLSWARVVRTGAIARDRSSGPYPNSGDLPPLLVCSERLLYFFFFVLLRAHKLPSQLILWIVGSNYLTVKRTLPFTAGNWIL